MTHTQKKVKDNLHSLATLYYPYMDLEADSIKKEGAPEKCSQCGFFTETGHCGSPWAPAEAEENGIDFCFEGIYYYYTGIPQTHLDRLITDGREAPFLRVIDKLEEEKDPEGKELPF